MKDSYESLGAYVDWCAEHRDDLVIMVHGRGPQRFLEVGIGSKNLEEKVKNKPLHF